MHKDLSERYSTVESMALDITRVLDARPVSVRSTSISYRVSRFVRRNRWWVVFACAVVLLLIGFGVLYARSLTRSGNAAQEQSARLQAILNSVVKLFDSKTDPSVPADQVKAVMLLERGSHIADALTSDREAQADLRRTLGAIYLKLGKLDDADRLLKQALEGHKELDGNDRSGIAEDMLAIAELRGLQARFGEEESTARQALGLVDLRPVTAPSRARALTLIGDAEEQEGHYKTADTVLKQAELLEENDPASEEELPETLSKLSDSAFSTGRYPEARAVMLRTLDVERKLYGPSHPSVAETVADIGEVDEALGHYKEAEKNLRESVDMLRTVYGPEHPETVAKESLLAQTLTLENRFDEARALLEHALGAEEKVYGRNHPRVAITLNAIGIVEDQQDHLPEALRYYEASYDVFKQSLGPHHYKTLVALSNVGVLHRRNKEFGKAEEIFRTCVTELTKSVGAENQNTAIADINLGRTLLREGKVEEASRWSSAGLIALSKSASPSVNWAQGARHDLVQDYRSLKRDAEADRVEAEIQQIEAGRKRD